MRPRVYWLVVFLLAGCAPTEPGVGERDEVQGEVESETSGETSIPLAISGVAYNKNTAGPVMLLLEMELPTESTVQVRMNDTLIVEEPIGTSCQQLPAVTVCGKTLYRKQPVIVEQGGLQRFELTAIKGGDWRTEKFTTEVTQASCQSNQSVYLDRMQPVLQQACAQCHGNGDAGVFQASDSWATLEPTLINRGELFYQFPSGQEPGHAVTPFAPYDATWRLFAEMVWRAEQGFSCS